MILRQKSAPLVVPITPDDRPHNAQVEITTRPEHPRKAFSAGGLVYTYLDMLQYIWSSVHPPPHRAFAGCTDHIISDNCSFFDSTETFSSAVIAWGIISVLTEEFRLNRQLTKKIWIVETWAYFIDGNLIGEMTNSFEDELRKANTNRTFSDLQYRPVQMDLHFTGSFVPIRTILLLLCDLSIRFFFPLGRFDIISSHLPQGYKWQTHRDPSSGAVITLEILDTSVAPQHLYPQITIGDLYMRGIHERLLKKWDDNTDEEAMHQETFEANFHVNNIIRDFARITLNIPSNTEGLEDMNDKTWVGNSLLLVDPGAGSNDTNGEIDVVSSVIIQK